MQRHWYALGWALLAAVFGVLAAVNTVAFALGAVACFAVGLGVERGVLSGRRLAAALPFEVHWKERKPRGEKVPRPLGILDWEVAFEEQGRRMRRAFERVKGEMEAITGAMTEYAPRFDQAQDMPARQKVDLSRAFAKRVRPHAKRMESAEAEAGAAIAGFSDNYLKRMSAYPPEQDLGPLRESVASLEGATHQTLGSVRTYRESVQELRGTNLQQDTNEVLDQLLLTAGRLVNDVEAAEAMAGQALAVIDGRKSTTGVNRAERRRRQHQQGGGGL